MEGERAQEEEEARSSNEENGKGGFSLPPEMLIYLGEITAGLDFSGSQ